MTTRKLYSASIGVHDWRELYKVALFETDRQKLPSRLSDAERALLLRAKELLATSVKGEEWHAVEKARYALRALRSCTTLKTSKPTSA
jgi:hypothetical protein